MQEVSAAYSFPDYKALVCLFIVGGNDSSTCWSRDRRPGYSEYSDSRGNLSLVYDPADPLAAGSEILTLSYDTTLPEYSSINTRLNNWAVWHPLQDAQLTATLQRELRGYHGKARRLSRQCRITLRSDSQYQSRQLRYQTTDWSLFALGLRSPLGKPWSPKNAETRWRPGRAA